MSYPHIKDEIDNLIMTTEGLYVPSRERFLAITKLQEAYFWLTEAEKK